jgi:hypothetical protein
LYKRRCEPQAIAILQEHSHPTKMLKKKALMEFAEKMLFEIQIKRGISQKWRCESFKHRDL